MTKAPGAAPGAGRGSGVLTTRAGLGLLSWFFPRETDGDASRVEGLRSWHQENGPGYEDNSSRDPTALVYVDRAMKRLGFTPANPGSAIYDDDPNPEEVWQFEITMNGRFPDP